MKIVTWTIIVLLICIVCAVAGAIVLYLTNNFDAAFSVAFCGGILLCVIASL